MAISLSTIGVRDGLDNERERGRKYGDMRPLVLPGMEVIDALALALALPLPAPLQAALSSAQQLMQAIGGFNGCGCSWASFGACCGCCCCGCCCGCCCCGLLAACKRAQCLVQCCFKCSAQQAPTATAAASSWPGGMLCDKWLSASWLEHWDCSIKEKTIE